MTHRRSVPNRNSEKSTLLVTRRILRLAGNGSSRIDFCREALALLLEYTDTDSVEVQARDGHRYFRAEKRLKPEPAFELEAIEYDHDGTPSPSGPRDSAGAGARPKRPLLADLESATPSDSVFAGHALWTNDTLRRGLFVGGDPACPLHLDLVAGRPYRSVVVLSYPIDSQNSGLLILRSCRADHFSQDRIPILGEVAQSFGVAVLQRRSVAALRERVKELSCLYTISNMVGNPELSLDTIAAETVKLLPPAFLYPDIATARITINDTVHCSANWQLGPYRISRDIVGRGRKRGSIEVFYTVERPEFREGPFLEEEGRLLGAIADQLSTAVERKQAEMEALAMQQQLDHADRLATIGQLAAGVAHEINEPLANILGFAQLVKKNPGLPAGAQDDVGRIVSASLYMREIVRKLLIFARQMPSEMACVNLNSIVHEALSLFDYRLSKERIVLTTDLSPVLPPVQGASSQLTQVFVNLIVNAMQAMPTGGTLSVTSSSDGHSVFVGVADTGYGIEKENLERIFLPFFSTKDVGQGTGLGLAVVHGILQAHRGTIQVESQPGAGTRMTVVLPAYEPASDGDMRCSR